MCLMKVKVEYIFFVLSLFLYFFITYTQQTELINYLSDDVLSVIRYSIIFSLIICLCLQTFFYKKIVYTISIILISFCVWQVCQNYTIFVLLLFVAASKYIKFDFIVKLLFCLNSVFLLSVFLCCFLSILPDNIYIRSVGNNLVAAHSLGFTYYSFGSYISISLIFLYIYIRNQKITNIELFVIVFFSLVYFHYHTVRLTIVIEILLVICYLIFAKYQIINLSIILFRLMSFFLIPFCFTGSVVLSLLTRHLNFAFPNKLFGVDLSTLNSRLGMNALSFEIYQPSLLGHRVRQIGNYTLESQGLDSSEYFYIDNVYIYMLCSYGIILSVIILYLYNRIYRFSYISNSYIFISITIFAVASLVNDLLLNILYCPIIFLLLKANNNEIRGER